MGGSPASTARSRSATRHVAVSVVRLEPLAAEELRDRFGLGAARVRRLERRVERALLDRGVGLRPPVAEQRERRRGAAAKVLSLGYDRHLHEVARACGATADRILMAHVPSRVRKKVEWLLRRAEGALLPERVLGRGG